MPVEVIRASRPLPGIRLRRPGNVYPVQLEVTLSRPPGTLAVREVIPLAAHGWRAALRHMVAWNAHRLIDVNQVGVREMVMCRQLLPRRAIPRGNAAERVAALNHIDLVATGARRLGERAK